MKPVGYLINTKAGLIGERGVAYDYVFAGNGVFVESEGKFMAARVPVALAAKSFWGIEIRGLEETAATVALRNGKIPADIFNLAMDTLFTDLKNERFVAITCTPGAIGGVNEYHVVVPPQDGKMAFVHYERPEDIVLEMHSHPTFSMSFSDTDNRDQQGFQLYGVVSDIDKNPVLHLRVGVYGYMNPIPASDIIEGGLVGVIDGYALDMEEETLDDWEDSFKARLTKDIDILKGKRRELAHDLHTDNGASGEEPGHSRSWLRWDRWFRSRRSLPPTGED